MGHPRHNTDPDAAEAVRLDAAVDASLRRVFAPPPAPAELLDRLRSAAPASVPAGEPPAIETHAAEPIGTSESRIRRRRFSLVRYAVAASLLAFVGFWSLYGERLVRRLTQPVADYTQRNVLLVYENAVSQGFRPDWFCDDEKPFADTFFERQGAGVWLRTLPDGVRMAGLAYLRGLSPAATCLLAWVDDEPVLVVVERAGKIPTELLVPRSGARTRIFQQTLGGLQVIEVTPHDAPRVSGSLYLAAPPAAPTGRVPGAA